MSVYRKPLAGGGSRLIPRTGGGRFARAALDCKVCPQCGAINFREPLQDHRATGGFVCPRQPWPEKCKDCSADLEGGAI